jgi:hypothetical protein
MLFAFVQQKKENLKVVYFISGCSKSTGNHEISLVSDSKLQGIAILRLITETKAQYDPITSIHVYSVQTAVPIDTAQFWSQDYAQFVELQQKGKMSQFFDNRS